MAKKSSEYADLGSGTFEIPGTGLVLNGELLDGNDPDAIRAFHERDLDVPAPEEPAPVPPPVLPEPDNTVPTP